MPKKERKSTKIKFKDLPKKDKIFRIINLTLTGVMLAVIIALTIYFGVIGDPRNRLWAGCAMIVAALAPLIIELVFRTRLSNSLYFGILVYVIIAGIWGSLLSGYVDCPWLDIVVHTIMGYLCAMMGIFLISRLTDYKKISPLAVLFFCFFFSLAVELVWELAEWFSDLFVGQTAQGIKILDPETGKLAPQVTDTMEDILCNFCGAIVFAIHFAIGKFSKCSLGIRFLENDLAKGMKEVALPQVDLAKDNTEKVEQLSQNLEENKLEDEEKVAALPQQEPKARAKKNSHKKKE